MFSLTLLDKNKSFNCLYSKSFFFKNLKIVFQPYETLFSCDNKTFIAVGFESSELFYIMVS